MVRNPWVLIALVATAAVSAVPAGAAVSFPARDVEVSIDGTASDFSDATVRIANTFQVGAGSSGSRVFTSVPFPTITSTVSKTSGDVTLTNEVDDLPNLITATVNATGPGGGTFGFDNTYTTLLDPGGPGPLYRYLRTGDAVYAPIPFAASELPGLELFLPIEPGVDAGGTFTVGFSIQGDYSNTAYEQSTAGQHWLVGLDPAWEIKKNFVFDAASQRTSFIAVNASADPSQILGLDVYFVGAVVAVPEPASWLSLAVGLACLGVVRRRRHASR